MIYEMHRDITETLRSRKFPFPVYYGPERHKRDRFDTSIIFERDRGSSDVVEPVKGAQRNPRKREVRELAAMATIFAKSTLPGALIGEHERLCEQLVDAVIIALEEWGTATGAGYIPITEAKYLSAAEFLAELEAPAQISMFEGWPGVVYRLKFRVPRGMRVETFLGEAQPTGAAAGVSNTTNVRLVGQEDGDPAVGCGS